MLHCLQLPHQRRVRLPTAICCPPPNAKHPPFTTDCRPITMCQTPTHHRPPTTLTQVPTIESPPTAYHPPPCANRRPLLGETANGKFPDTAVRTMAAIVAHAENANNYLSMQVGRQSVCVCVGGRSLVTLVARMSQRHHVDSCSERVASRPTRALPMCNCLHARVSVCNCL